MPFTSALSIARLAGAGAVLALAGCAAPRTEPPLIAAKMLSCPRPGYPREALRNESTGTTTLAFLIGRDGQVHEAKVTKSSGHENLDREAMTSLSGCKFMPATRGGKPVESLAPVQFVWTLG